MEEFEWTQEEKDRQNAIAESTGYLARDVLGYWYNTKFPPNHAKYHKNNGYKDFIEETFFFDYAVNSYEVVFKYNGVEYEILIKNDGNHLLNKSNGQTLGVYESPIDLLEHATIEGNPFLILMKKFEDIDIY